MLIFFCIFEILNILRKLKEL